MTRTKYCYRFGDQPLIAPSVRKYLVFDFVRGAYLASFGSRFFHTKNSIKESCSQAKKIKITEKINFISSSSLFLMNISRIPLILWICLCQLYVLRSGEITLRGAHSQLFLNFIYSKFYFNDLIRNRKKITRYKVVK